MHRRNDRRAAPALPADHASPVPQAPLPAPAKALRRRPRVAAICAAFVACPLMATAQEGFEACVRSLGEAAISAGISRDVTASVLPTVRELPRVVAADRDQAEFVETFATYLSRRATPARVEQGRERMREHRALLDRLAGDYGVPPQVLLALWGLETNYGRVLGDVPVFNSLATLACEGRRGEYFTTEFVNALRIVEQGIDPPAMIGSWAGAIGQTQFMPSTYLAYAVDGDGNGRVDVWGSVPDALASAANLLQNLGWQAGWRWGREVVLPPDFDYRQAGRDRARSLREWRDAGVTMPNGQPVPALDERAAVLVPSGHAGPAFLVYRNFDVFMRWNRSESFALSVGILSDLIAGSDGLHRPPPTSSARVTREHVAEAQRRLTALGFDSGAPDGIVGSATRAAVRDFQHERGLIADGHVDAELLRALEIFPDEG